MNIVMDIKKVWCRKRLYLECLNVITGLHLVITVSKIFVNNCGINYFKVL